MISQLFFNETDRLLHKFLTRIYCIVRLVRLVWLIIANLVATNLIAIINH